MEILGLDIGSKRIGVARINDTARIPEALEIIENNTDAYSKVSNLVKLHNIERLVIGLPRNMSGQETAQTQEVKKWLSDAPKDFLNELEIVYADETLSSVNAKELYPDEKHIDHYAAGIILEMYVSNLTKKGA